MENLPIEYRDGSSPMPSRKRLDHRGPLSIDISSAWYFITICAEGHRPWMCRDISTVGGGHRAPRDCNSGATVGGDHRAPRLSSMRISADISFGLSAPEYAIIYASSRDVGMPPEADRERQRKHENVQQVLRQQEQRFRQQRKPGLSLQTV
jgi:hypothetical protein